MLVHTYVTNDTLSLVSLLESMFFGYFTKEFYTPFPILADVSLDNVQKTIGTYHTNKYTVRDITNFVQ